MTILETDYLLENLHILIIINYFSSNQFWFNLIVEVTIQAFIIYILSLYSQKHRNSVSTAMEYTWKNVDDITQDPAATMNIGSHLLLRTG